MPRANCSDRLKRALSGGFRRKLIVLLLPICVLVTLVPPALPPVQAAESSPAKAEPAPPKIFPEGVDLPAIADSPPKAYSVAPSTGSPPKVQRWAPNQELVEKRTATSKTFMGEKPGQLETRLYSDAIHFKDGARWTEIDSGLTGRTNGRRTSKANSFELQFADRASDPALATLALDSAHSVSFGLQGAAPVEATRSKDSLTFAKVLPGTDLRLTSQPSGIKEDLILASPNSPDRFVFPLQLKGLTAAINQAGDVVYQDSAGVERARTPHGFMFDSKIDPDSGEPAISFGVNYSLIPHGKGTALEVVLDRAWRDSPDRVWPLTVDPQVHAVRTWGDDTYVQYPYVNNYSTQTELKVGTPDGGASKARSYAHFDTGVLAGKNITSAVLYAAESWSWNCAAGPGPVHRVNQPWSGSTMTSFPGAPVDAAQATGAWYPGIGSCRDRLAYWVVTPQVATMAAVGEGAGSFSFRAPSETDNNQWKKYKSYETGDGPYLSVEYASGDPFGSIDESTPVAGGIVVRGWVIDPDTAASTQVHIYVGSAGVALNANTYRPDVGTHYPGYGNYHGFDAVISAAPGTHNVCFYGINIAGPGTNPLLGPCRTITVPAANVPGIPPNATATANPDGSVGVSWSPASTNSWSPVDFYLVYSYYADNTYSGQYKIVYCTGPCTSTSFSGLPIAGQFFYVFAHNAGGYGNPAATNTVTPKTVPSAPANAVATALDDGTVRVNWSLSTSNGGATIDFHVIHAYKKMTDGSFVYAEKYRIPCATCTQDVFNDLTAGTTYKFYVYAHNSVGYSLPAGTNTVIASAVPQATVPGIPRTPTATVDGDNVDVTWTAPASDGGSAITGYKVRAHLATTDAAVGDQPLTCGAACTSIEFTGLTAGTGYRFKIYAVNPVGDSPAAVTDTITIPEEDAGPVKPSAPVNVQVTGSSSQITVTWEPAPDHGGTPGNGGSSLTGHKIILDPVCSGCTGLQVSGETFASTIGSVGRGTTYVISVVATNSVGDSVPSTPVQFTTDSDPPDSPRITTVTESDALLTVAWEGPEEDNGSVITGYEISIDPPCPNCSGLTVGSPLLSQTEISGLTNDTEYTLKVAALYAGGSGAQSEPHNGTPYRPDYVAIGDSYSSGQGAPPYDEDSGDCLRSELAYGPLFNSGAGSSLDEFKFSACASADVSGISDQLSELPEHIRPGLITLTAGGNDAEFGDVLRFCGLEVLDCHEESQYAGLYDKITQFHQRLTELYLQAKTRANAKDAQVIVFGYPQLFTAIKDNDCLSDLGFEHEERIWIRSLVSHMNDVIQGAADEVGVTVIQLAGPTPDGDETAIPGPFDGNEICGADPYINGLTYKAKRYYHPNPEGYAAMRDLLTQTWQGGTQ